MLGKLVQREDDNQPVLTSSKENEKAVPYPLQNNRAQLHEDVSKDTFHGGRKL
jgi:error-prone DNA polymerase